MKIAIELDFPAWKDGIINCALCKFFKHEEFSSETKCGYSDEPLYVD